MIRVLIADDQALVRDGLRAIAEQEDDIEVVGEATEGGEAIRLSRELSPDVVLMDVRMPGLDGIEATRRLLSDPDPPRVLMLTTFDLNEYVYEAMKAGASGFLLKDMRRGQLTQAIRTVVAGEDLVAPSITRRLIEEFCRRPSPKSGAPADLAGLTSRETEVLTLMARGLSNSEIAGSLVIGETTVKTHVARVLTKLELRDRVQAVVFAYECGLVRAGDRDDEGNGLDASTEEGG
ncbi:MAG: response regulator [Actinobacteria bacterium]|nr:response regulator [Actinomycetota bacterium]